MDAVVQALINLVAALIVAVTPIIVGGVIVAVKKRFNDFLITQPDNVREAYRYAATLGIRLAESVYTDFEPEQKLQKALEAGKEWIVGMGYEEPDTDMLRTSIEALLDAVKLEIFTEKSLKQTTNNG